MVVVAIAVAADPDLVRDSQEVQRTSREVVEQSPVVRCVRTIQKVAA